MLRSPQGAPVIRPRCPNWRQGELPQLEGRPGPKSRANDGHASRLHLEHSCVGHLAVSRTPHSRLACRVGDTRVGGSSGRCPPEALKPCPQNFTKIAKHNDPFFRTFCRQYVCPLLTLPTSLMGWFPTFIEFHPTITSTRHYLGASSCVHQATLRADVRRSSAGADPQASALSLSVLLSMHVLLGIHRQTPPRPWTCTRCRPGSYRRRPGAFCRRALPSRRSDTAERGFDGPVAMPQHVTAGPTPRTIKQTCRCIWFFSILGRGASMQNTGTRGVDLKPHQPTLRTQPPQIAAYGHLAARLSTARKRSFKRAQLRVMRDGETMYRGRRHTADSLSLRYIGQRPVHPRQPATPPPPPNSLRVITWNCGGLHSSRYAELMAWLNSSQADPVHVVMLQECHWPQSTEFHSDNWFHIYSGSGASQAGVMIIVNRSIAQPHQIRFAELQPGRVLHTRIALDPPLDVLCVYQHAWSSLTGSVRSTLARDTARTELLNRRSHIWRLVDNWVRAVPARNALLIGGDMNASLSNAMPNVGHGTQPHKFPHSDQPEFQQLVVSNGLIAMNTWGRSGQHSGTYLGANHSVQIDYLLTRLPSSEASRRARALRQAPIAHPTGLRHVPVTGYIPRPTAPRSQPNMNLRPLDVHNMLRKHPDLAQTYQLQVTVALEQDPHQGLDGCMQAAWRRCVRQVRTQPKNSSPPAVSLQSFWTAKRALRMRQQAASAYYSPLVWHIATSTVGSVYRALPHTVRKLRPLLLLWRAMTHFGHQDRTLRKRVKQRKQQQVDELIAEAQVLDGRGISALHLVVKKLRPRMPRRSIHLRDSVGHLLSDQAELECLTSFFKQLFQSDDHLRPVHALDAPMHIQQSEVDEAICSLPARKALPPGHAPAVLWKLARDSVGPKLTEVFEQHLQAGPLHFPQHWHESYLTLLAKPSKPPNCPANLRPINLLPAEAKILARIAAARLRPLVVQAVQTVPQFAFVSSRQCSDAIDRVLAHCHRIRERLKGQHRNAWRPSKSATSHRALGGLQMSMDLTKAFDRLPHKLLQAALERVGASTDLLTLVLYIHDHAQVVISRHDLSSSVAMGRGIRQGCGLSPLLWITFTLLIHDKLSMYIPAEAQTSYADDFHLQWEFETEQGCRNACRTIPKVIADLQALGMDVSLGKTVILWAIKGSQAPKLLKEFTTKVKGERVFRVPTSQGTITLPLRRTHDYLGIKIGYHGFERSTVQHRLQLSWVAMHRLHDLLKHKLIPVRKRVLLWQSCVWSVAAYGLTAVGLDQVSAQKLHSGIMRQLRLVARSPSHISHIPNAQLLQQLQLQDPLTWLDDHCRLRVSRSQDLVGRLQPAVVHQWWTVLRTTFSLYQHPPPDAGVLTEVTQILRIRSACPVCGQYFPSKHALKVHIGKQHPDQQPRHEPNPTIKNQRRDDYRRYAKGGKPQCRFCLKKFSGWPQFMGHFHQNACPRMQTFPVQSAAPADPEPVITPTDTGATVECPHQTQPPVSIQTRACAPTGAEVTEALAEPDPVPLFHRPDLQELAKQGDVKQLGAAIRQCKLMNHCPECFQWVTKPSYLSRHAVKMHASVRALQKPVEQWAQQRGGLTKPCQWCGEANFTRHSLHLKSCPVLWMIGHFLGRHSSLRDPGQTVLHGFIGGGTSGCQPGVRAVRGLYAEASSPPDGQSVATSLHGSDPATGSGDARDGEGNGCRQGQAPARDATGGDGGATNQVGQIRCQRRQERGPDGRELHRQGQISGSHSQGPGSDGEHVPAGNQGTARPGGKLPTRRTAGLEADRLPAMARQTGQEGSRLRRPVREQGGPRAAGVEGGSESHGTAFAEIRGQLRGDELGYRVYPVFANGGVRQRVCDHPAAVQHRHRVEEAERGAARIIDEPHAEHPPLQPLQRPPHEARSSGGGSGADGQSPRQGPGRRVDIPVFAMGSCDQTAHQGDSPASGALRGGFVGQDPALPVDVPERRRAFPRPPQDDGGEHGRGHHSFYVGRPEPHAGVPPDVHPNGKTFPQFDLALNRRDGQTVQTGPLTIGQAPGPPHSGVVILQASAVQQLILQNHSNHCYANAIVQALAWTAASSPSGISCADPALCRFLRWLARPASSDVHVRQPVNLWSTRPWNVIVRAWQEPNRQHDAGEFLQFLAPKLAITHAADCWQAREITETSITQVMDQGTLWPLTLTAPLAAPLHHVSPTPPAVDQPISLQRLVIMWRNQASRHAMLSEPAWLPLQVCRFTPQGQKCHRPVQISDAVYLPSFVGHTLQTTSTRYQLTAIIYHLGISLLAGHYRAALCARGSIVSITDDGISAQPASEAEIQSVYRNSYIFILKRC